MASARIAELQGHDAFAAKSYQSILDHSPTHVEALTNLGNLKKKERRFNEAEALYRKGLAQSPHSAVLHKNLADLLARTFRIEEAIQEINDSVSEAPDNPYLHSELIFTEHYSSTRTPEQLRKTIEAWRLKFGRSRDTSKTLGPPCWSFAKMVTARSPSAL